MIKKEIKEYARGNSFNYRINIAKQDKLPKEVYILTPNEYNILINENETLKKELENKNVEIKKFKTKLDNTEANLNLMNKTITEINNTNNENINQLNETYAKKYENLTALNTVLISGLENLQSLGFIDRVTNKNKQIVTKLIKENIKNKPNKEFELKEKKD